MTNEHIQAPGDLQREIDSLLRSLQQKGVNSSDKPTLMVNTIAQMRGRNNGYPKDLYHEHLEARQAVNQDQEEMLIAQGYGPRYIDKRWPKMLYRRNMSPKFAANPDPGTGNTDHVNEYVEHRIVKTEQAETQLLAKKPEKGCGAWFEKLTDLPDLDTDAPDQSLQIAMLEGQLAEARHRAAEAQADTSPVKERRREAAKEAAKEAA